MIEGNSYPGRGILLGQSADGQYAALAYFIMGRSENSRNRRFVQAGDGLEIRVFQPEKMRDPSLILYTPFRILGNRQIITNGDQTDTVFNEMKNGKTFEDALSLRCFEPDAPNFTPRISGIASLDAGRLSYKLSILKAGDAAGRTCVRNTFAYEGVPGEGRLIHTYAGDGNPLPSFSGEPERVMVPADFDTFANGLWNSLNPENRVSLYVRFSSLTGASNDRTRVFNKHEGD